MNRCGLSLILVVSAACGLFLGGCYNTGDGGSTNGSGSSSGGTASADGGTGDGGTGGTVGDGGTSGSGSSGGSGTGTTTGDVGGDGSTSGGSGGGTGGATIKYCARECGSVSDCTGSGGNTDYWKCSNGTCEPDMCNKDEECTPVLSGWTNEGCDTDGCRSGNTCVKHAGSTYCAIEALEGQCEFGMPMQKQTPDGSTVEVCGKTGVCNSSLCLDSDSSGGTCESGDCKNGGSCNSDGYCTCTSGDCDSGYQCVQL